MGHPPAVVAEQNCADSTDLPCFGPVVNEKARRKECPSLRRASPWLLNRPSFASIAQSSCLLTIACNLAPVWDKLPRL